MRLEEILVGASLDGIEPDRVMTVAGVVSIPPPTEEVSTRRTDSLGFPGPLGSSTLRREPLVGQQGTPW
jgi:hypothetical protein